MRKREGDKERDILSAAIEVFAERGFHDTRIHSIADRAGIATGTIYLYFGNKENILLRIFEVFWEQLYNRFESINNSESLKSFEKYKALVDSLFDYFSRNPALALLYVNEQNYLMHKKTEEFTSFYRKAMGLIEKCLNEGIIAGAFDSSISASIAGRFFLGGFRLLIQEWVRAPERYGLDELQRNIKTLLFTGLTGCVDLG
ncbi:MAG TPA: TetR/AcrR family transcriptional regulator [Chitinispirillaceae bacterium]|nr:TetR/AcrR family transcriptional regulator [Chitinispirillaceae bacterium]